MIDPFTFIKNLISGVLRKNIVIIIFLAVVLAGSAWFVSQTITKVTPDVIRAINATTELIEKVNEAQAGFAVALEKIAGLESTIARIERIINRIPDRLLRDEVTGEWDTSWVYEVSEEEGKYNEEYVRGLILEILQNRQLINLSFNEGEQEETPPAVTPEPTPQPQPPIQVVPRRLFGR